ncbi:N-formylglutamate amidohydrolase [Neptunicoccus cionae]|uniref:N-formylglutamate amidohydrolase n=1 Tax=Neptunicoccus cionae TaxID=2035344 RepID=A0A916QX40_9RHOB|nr:N-formylglutamate amidohydrolase [Amylibacter cionae]GGA16649.1 N-formylglutamate amidohydrolase [Amylibacter cionae]
MAATKAEDVVEVHTPAGASPVVLVCEHASSFIPPHLHDLGLAEADRLSHAAWDPGALGVARHMSERLNAKLVASKVSRLVYDCNRPPSAPDAMPARSELVVVPGNGELDDADRRARADSYYHPFRELLADSVAATAATGVTPVLVTVHSFTPIYHGNPRAVEIGILHDSDTRLADGMLAAAKGNPLDVQRNEPYGPEHGVTHTLKEHGIANGYANVMLEIRNDLIVTQQQQQDMGDTICDWLVASLDRLDQEGQA